jgi:membrane fusion protein
MDGEPFARTGEAEAAEAASGRKFTIRGLRHDAFDGPSVRSANPLRVRTVSYWWLVGFQAIAVALAVVFVSSTSYADKSTVDGMLTPAAGLLGVTADRAGVITRLYVKDGDRVAAGAPVATISPSSVVAGGRPVSTLLGEAADVQADQTLRERQQDLAVLEAQVRDLRARQAANAREEDIWNGERRLDQQRLELAQRKWDAMKSLSAKGFVAVSQVQTAESAKIDAEVSLREIDRNLSTLAGTIAQAQAEDVQLAAKLKAARAAVAAADPAALQQRATALGEGDLTVRAPQAGQIGNLQALLGQTVAAGASLAVVAPAGSRLQAQLQVPSRAIGFVQVGDSVSLMYQGYPYQKYGLGHGRVIEVPAAPAAGQDPHASDTTYAVRVALDEPFMRSGKDVLPLIAGMKLQGVVTLERRSILAWVFEPLIGIKARSTA